MAQELLNDEILGAIKATYLEYFEQRTQELHERGMKDEVAEKVAQKFAIRNTILRFFSLLEPRQKAQAWTALYAVHVGRKAGVEILPEQAQKVISADQSWKKSSGHAFEEVVKELGNRALAGTGMELVLQRDMGPLFRSGSIRNDERDQDWLREQIASSVFDLFVMKEGKVFGCVQAKTSVRDRVTRDREPSTSAMDHFF